MFQSGEMPAFKVNGKLWRTTREAADEYIRVRMDSAKHAPHSSKLRMMLAIR
jgi:hypothetical protein